MTYRKEWEVERSETSHSPDKSVTDRVRGPEHYEHEVLII